MMKPTYLVPLLTGICGLALGIAGSYVVNKSIPPAVKARNDDAPAGKRQLVEAVLEKLDMPRRYNESIAAKAMQVAGPAPDAKTAKWMRDLWIQQLGWEQAKDAFIRHYSEALTEADLKELAGLLDQPPLTKLLAVEAASLEASSQERADRFAKFWQRYNNLEFPPP